MLTQDFPKPRRIELILGQIDSLPTLPAIATRVLELTTSDQAHMREVVELIGADPALSAKVLTLCREASDRAHHHEVLSVERAVSLLGFNAVRNAVLSLKVFEVFETGGEVGGSVPGAEAARSSSFAEVDDIAEGFDPLTPSDPSIPGSSASRPASGVGFDRRDLWVHCLAVGTLAQAIAQAHGKAIGVNHDDAFICGLLHDIGKLALDHVLPKSFARVVELAELNHGDIAEYERRVIGIDHHTAGKRLAEQWGLPHKLQDCIWLHGSDEGTLPRLQHRPLIGLIRLADTLVRHLHLGSSGNPTLRPDPEPLAHRLGLDPDDLPTLTDALPDKLQARAQALGLDATPSREMLRHAIGRANLALGRLNQQLDQRGRVADEQAHLLQAIADFHTDARPGRSVGDVLDGVARSAHRALGPGFYALLHPTRDGDDNGDSAPAWLIAQYDAEARRTRAQYIDPPAHGPDLGRLDSSQPLGLELAGVLPWVGDHLREASDWRRVKLLALPSGWGTAALLLHDRPEVPAWHRLQPLAGAWGAAIASAAGHDGARRLGEQLNQANAALGEAQDRLVRRESMARLGEMASGAAHEMNNPLAIIAGRSQLLTMMLEGGSEPHVAAQAVLREAHRLSDLITCLRLFADPPRAHKRPMDLGQLLDDTIRRIQAGQRRRGEEVDISLTLKHQLPPIHVDGDQISRVLCELLANAIQANPRTGIQVTAHLLLAMAPPPSHGHAVAEPIPGGRSASDGPTSGGPRGVMVRVIDDGQGMDAYALDHALDPFFSAKPAGRRVGMGLARAQQWLQAHGATLQLHAQPDRGTTACFTLPLDSPFGSTDEPPKG